ncbi:MAG TPA: cold shock domain-containing protein [Flavisolibacter sp.]|jgi:cold shock CspA family protein
MARSRETFGKREKEKKRMQQRQEKKDKMLERKENGGKKSLDDMIAYIDEDGNLSSTPPDPKKKKVFNSEDIEIGVPKYVEEESAGPRQGVVSYFNTSKGFGFIIDGQTGERIFVHINQLSEPISENDKVSFEVEAGDRGLSAVQVKKL